MTGFTNLKLASLENKTPIHEVFILGFQNLREYKTVLFLIIFTIYTMTLFGNILVIIIMLSSKLFHSPMYFFLCNLSMSEILLTTNIVPNMLYAVLKNGVVMSINECFTQLYMFGTSVATESLLLTVMSYDRYLAICRPLHYASIMNFRSCYNLTLACWVLASIITSVSVIFISTLYFCGLNIIDHFFCDFAPLLKLSCSDTSAVQLEVSLLSTTATIFPFLIIILTYCLIIRCIVRMPSLKGKEKAFSTCSSHLGVVSTYYITIIMVYVAPTNSHSMIINKVISLLYTMLTPMINPIIYTLRNQEIITALSLVFKKVPSF